MGNLEVTFQLGLAYSISFSEGHTKGPRNHRLPGYWKQGLNQPARPKHFVEPLSGDLTQGTLTLQLERECTDEQNRDTSHANNERLSINRDAGRALRQFFETVCEIESQNLESYFTELILPSE